jgi:hypothetical protein
MSTNTNTYARRFLDSVYYGVGFFWYVLVWFLIMFRTLGLIEKIFWSFYEILRDDLTRLCRLAENDIFLTGIDGYMQWWKKNYLSVF